MNDDVGVEYIHKSELSKYIQEPLYCFGVRGANGSGKSSIVHKFIETDGHTEEIFVEGIKKTAFVYSPMYNILFLGSYRTACGGCDTFVKEQIVKLLKMAWNSSANIMFEGIIVGDSGKPYYYLMKELNEIRQRVFGFIYLDVSIETCLARVYSRNKGKAIKEELVKDKHKNANKYYEWQKSQGDAFVVKVNAEKPIEEVFQSILNITKKIAETQID